MLHDWPARSCDLVQMWMICDRAEHSQSFKAGLITITLTWSVMTRLVQPFTFCSRICWTSGETDLSLSCGASFSRISTPTFSVCLLFLNFFIETSKAPQAKACPIAPLAVQSLIFLSFRECHCKRPTSYIYDRRAGKGSTVLND